MSAFVENSFLAEVADSSWQNDLQYDTISSSGSPLPAARRPQRQQRPNDRSGNDSSKNDPTTARTNVEGTWDDAEGKD
jgi:hypothetical protein